MPLLPSFSVQRYIDCPSYEEVLPPDLGKDDALMKVQLEGRHPYDRYLLKPFKRKYHVNHPFVDHAEFSAPRCADAERYRCVFLIHVMHMGYGAMAEASYTYNVYDPVPQKIHNPAYSSVLARRIYPGLCDQPGGTAGPDRFAHLGKYRGVTDLAPMGWCIQAVNQR